MRLESVALRTEVLALLLQPAFAVLDLAQFRARERELMPRPAQRVLVLGELAAQLRQIATGLGELAAHLRQLAAHLRQLAVGLRQLAAGVGQLNSGLGVLGRTSPLRFEGSQHETMGQLFACTGVSRQ
jgi:X-X-X-Leu-X-X-Gly heptad repeat protein